MDTPWTHARLLQWMLRFNQWPASITHTCRAWTPPVKGWLCGNILPFTKALPHAVDLPSHTCLPPYLYNMFATFAALLGARGREQGEGPNMRSLEDGVETEGFKGSVAHQETPGAQLNKRKRQLCISECYPETWTVDDAAAENEAPLPIAKRLERGNEPGSRGTECAVA